MPTVSKNQEKFMQAVAHNPAFAKKAGVPQSVGKEFTKSGGGMPLKLLTESEKRSKDSDEDKRKVVGGMKKGGMAESKKMVGKEIAFMKKKGAPKSMIKHEMAEAGMKPKAKYMSFTEKGKPAGMKPVQMAKGGLAAGHKSADGVARKGKTKAEQVKMAGGGKTKKYC